MGFAVVGLWMPKNIINVGAALRAAGCYNASLVVTQGKRYRNASTDTAKSFRHIPLIHGVDDLFDFVPYGCMPVAVDIVPKATPLYKFTHPNNAFYIFGPEDGTLSNKVLSRCKHKVYIPTSNCMNLAATVNVILYDRMAKEIQKTSYYHESSVA